MLFLPQSVYDTRRRLWRDFEAGKIPPEKAFQKMLELDPDDHIGMVGLGRLQRDAGDLPGAEAYLWRAIQVHPCISVPYIELARVFFQRPESAALSKALGELGISKRLIEDPAFVEKFEFDKAGVPPEALDELGKLPPAAQGRLLARLIRTNPDDEPTEVTERLRQLRLIQQMQEDPELTRETVDTIIGEGAAMAPLLIGVLREWAQNLLEGDSLVEDALALLGETGSPSELPYLLEFVDLEHKDVSSAAKWALKRLVERHPEEAAEFFASAIAGMGPSERLYVAELILHRPDMDREGKLFRSLTENLDSLKRADRDMFFPLLLGLMAAAMGTPAVEMGRAALLKQSSLLSRDARLESDALLDALSIEGFAPITPDPSTVTVYDICEGNAVWDEDDEDDDEGEDDDEEMVPEPVQRKATPGRNDPCWCNSGKKYKKCHLDSDERQNGHAFGEAPAVSHDPKEFLSLRRRIGQFLSEVLSKREMELALKELYGDETPDLKDATIPLTDWIIHDWVAPSLGRTVLLEFLARHGSRLTQREREMAEAWTQSVVGLYEVQEITPGVGVALKDLIFDKTFFAHDVSMSKRLARWDGLLARVVPGERGTELAGTGFTVPRHSIDRLRQWMDREREEAGLEWWGYLKKNWPRVRRQAFELASNSMESLRLANTDSEELLLSKAVYRLVDEAAAMEALRHCPEFEADSDNLFVWLNQKHTLLGTIRIAKDELSLECNSKQRLERGKLLLSSIPETALRHLRDEFTTQKALKSQAASSGLRAAPQREPEIPEEERNEAISHYLAEHYRTWPDTKLPALSGKTPRQAVQTAKGRRKVIEVLKDIENGEDRKRRAGDPAYEVAKLRAELGLES